MSGGWSQDSLKVKFSQQDARLWPQERAGGLRLGSKTLPLEVMRHLLCQDLNPGLWIPNQAPFSIPVHPVGDRTRGHGPLGSHVQGMCGAELESSVRSLCKKTLRVPWTAKRSNWSILKEIIPEYSLEGLMLKLKFQYFGHLM